MAVHFGWLETGLRSRARVAFSEPIASPERPLASWFGHAEVNRGND